MSGIALAVLVALGLLLSPAVQGQAGGEEVWVVLKRTYPPPASRTDWISVAKAEAQGDGRVIVPRSPRTATTWAQAVASADAYRLSNDFKGVCDKRYKVIRSAASGALAVTGDPVPSGYILVQPELCCEDAFTMAFPPAAGAVPTGDCRTFQLLSVPGASVGLTPAGWRAVGGSPITIGTLPPVVVAAASPVPGGRDVGGGCREVGKQNQPQARDASGRITVEAAVIHVMNCPGQGEVFIYQYLNRPGFRAIRPPNWSQPLGGRDFPTFEQAQQAAAGGTPGQGNPQPPSGTCPDGSLAIMGVCSQGTSGPANPNVTRFNY